MEGLEINTSDTTQELEAKKLLDRRRLAAGGNVVSSTQQQPSPTTATAAAASSIVSEQSPPTTSSVYATVVSTTSRASSVESSKRKRAPAGNNYALDAKRRRDGPQPSQQQQQPPPQQERDESAFNIQNHPLAVASNVDFALSDANNLRNAWSLMIRFDFNLYIRALRCTDRERILTIRKGFHMLHLYMQMIVTYGKTHDLNYSLPAASITRLNKLVKKEHTYRINKNITLKEEGEIEKLRNSTKISTMIQLMDNEVHQLMIVLCKPQIPLENNNSTSKNQQRMILVQEVNDDMYQQYVANRIQQTDRQQYKINMNSFFVISLLPNDTSQFQMFHDRSGVLLKQIKLWIKENIFKGKPIPKEYCVSMNCKLTIDCKHHCTLKSLTAKELQQMKPVNKPIKLCDSKSGKWVSPNSLLDAHYDPSGVLALVNIGYIEIQPQKSINVEVNIEATFSSITTL